MSGLRLVAFSDPHGLWRLAAAIAAAYRDATGRWPTGMLCGGDTGYYPDPTRLDRATRRHGATRPEQVHGFARLLAPGGDPVIESLLGVPGDPAPPIVSIGGNHEDHEAFAALCKRVRTTPLVAADTMGRVQMLRDGHVHTFTDGAARCRVGALWGIEPGADRTKPRVPGRHIDPAAAKKLEGSSFDILLSHDGPLGPGLGKRAQQSGSPAIHTLVRRGRLGIFGHYHHHDGRTVSTTSGGTAHLIGILMSLGPAAAAEIDGEPGAWRFRYWTDVPGWIEAARVRIGALPPAAIGLPDGTWFDPAWVGAARGVPQTEAPDAGE